MTALTSLASFLAYSAIKSISFSLLSFSRRFLKLTPPLLNIYLNCISRLLIDFSMDCLCGYRKIFQVETSGFLTLKFIFHSKSSSGVTPKLEDFTFYVMDEANSLYNAQSIPIRADEVDPGDDEPIQNPDGLIHTDFKYDFLFQDMWIASWIY